MYDMYGVHESKKRGSENRFGGVSLWKIQSSVLILIYVHTVRDTLFYNKKGLGFAHRG